jgi:hypothetical protein
MYTRSISYCMGARGDFLSNFLWNPTPGKAYTHQSFNYIKFHGPRLNRNHIKDLFIDYTIESNEMITFFMWDKTLKNINPPNDNFWNFTKIYFTMLDSWKINEQMRVEQFAHTLDFKDFFNIDRMIMFYQEVNGKSPSLSQIQFVIDDNQTQQDRFKQNIIFHPARIAHKIFEFELINNLRQESRLWSIVDLWNRYTDPCAAFLHELDQCLVLSNYKN